MSSEMEEEIKRVPLGVALLSSPSIEMPILVDVRPRRSEHGGRAAEMVTSEKIKTVLPREEQNAEEKEEKKSMLARLLFE